MQRSESRFKKERWLIKKEVKSLLRSRWLILGFIISPMFAWLFQGAFISFVYDQSTGTGARSKVYFTLQDDGAMGESLFRNISENQFRNASYFGIYAYAADNNFISNNYFSNNSGCVRITGSEKNQVYGNNFINNAGGVLLCCNSEDNTIYYNNFISNRNF